MIYSLIGIVVSYVASAYYYRLFKGSMSTFQYLYRPFEMFLEGGLAFLFLIFFAVHGVHFLTAAMQMYWALGGVQ